MVTNENNEKERIPSKRFLTAILVLPLAALGGAYENGTCPVCGYAKTTMLPLELLFCPRPAWGQNKRKRHAG